MRVQAMCGVLFLSIVGAADADVGITYAIDGDCAVDPASMQVSGSRLRFESGGSAGSGSVLFDGLEDIVTFLDHEARTWHEIEVDLDAADYMGDVAQSSMHFVDREMQKAKAELEQACREMTKHGLSCPQALDPEQLMAMARGIGAGAAPDIAAALGAGADGTVDDEALQQMRQQLMGGADAGASADPRPALQPPTSSTAYADSGRDGRIDGSTCRWFEQRVGDRVTRAQCVATVGALSLAERDSAGLSRAMLVLQRFGSAFRPWMQRFGVADQPPPSSQGLVLAQRCYGTGGETMGSARAALSQAQLDDSVFEIPVGYRRQRMDGAQ